VLGIKMAARGADNVRARGRRPVLSRLVGELGPGDVAPPIPSPRLPKRPIAFPHPDVLPFNCGQPGRVVALAWRCCVGLATMRGSEFVEAPGRAGRVRVRLAGGVRRIDRFSSHPARGERTGRGPDRTGPARPGRGPYALPIGLSVHENLHLEAHTAWRSLPLPRRLLLPI
jgi:hypothetical protein